MRTLLLTLTLAACALPSALGPTPAGFEKVVVEQSQKIPSRTDWGSSFDLNTPARLQIDYSVEAGHRVTYYLMTDEQYQRVVNGEGREPTVQGADYIRKAGEIQGQGTEVTQTLSPTRYLIVFRNLEAQPVNVTMRAYGQRQ